MKSPFLVARVFVFLSAVTALAGGCAESAPLRMGTGYSAAADPAVALEQALAGAMVKLGGGEPAFVLFCENHLKPEGAEQLLPAIRRQLGQVPYLGVGLVGDSYTPLTDNGKGKGGFAVVVFGQGFDVRVFLEDAAVAQGGWLYQTGREGRAQQQEYAKSLEKIGHALTERVCHAEAGRRRMAECDPNSLVLIEGALHQPANYYLMQGVRKGLADFPHVTGGASADAGYIYHDGQVLRRKVAAVVISGPFDVVQTGMQRARKDLRRSYNRLFADASAALQDTKAIGAIFYACASWRCKDDELESGLTVHLPGLPLYGHCSGGEMGRRWAGDSVIAATDLGMLSLIVPKDTARGVGRKPPAYPPRMVRITGEISSDDPATSQAGYITDWLLLGPYSYSLTQADRPDGQDMLDKAFVPSEAALAPEPGAKVDGRQWQVYATDVPEARNEVVNLDMAYGYPNFAAAYMAARVICDKPVRARLYCGSDDYIMVWVNGRQVVHYNDEPRGARWDQERADIELRKGSNIIVAKVVDVVSGWEAIFRLTDREGRPLEIQALPWK